MDRKITITLILMVLDFVMICDGQQASLHGNFRAQCGRREIDTTRLLCCEGLVYARSGRQPACCGAVGYDAFYYYCCGTTIHRKHDYKLPQCCGTRAYDGTVATCLHGYLERKTELGSTCCRVGGEWRCCARHEQCCPNLPQGFRARVAASGQQNYERGIEVPGFRVACCSQDQTQADRSQCCASAMERYGALPSCCDDESTKPICCKRPDGLMRCCSILVGYCCGMSEQEYQERLRIHQTYSRPRVEFDRSDPRTSPPPRYHPLPPRPTQPPSYVDQRWREVATSAPQTDCCRLSGQRPICCYAAFISATCCSVIVAVPDAGQSVCCTRTRRTCCHDSGSSRMPPCCYSSSSSKPDCCRSSSRYSGDGYRQCCAGTREQDVRDDEADSMPTCCEAQSMTQCCRENMIRYGKAPRCCAQLEDRTGDRTGDRTVDNVYDRTGDRTGDRTYDRTGDRPYDRTGHRTVDNIYDRTGDRTSDRTVDNIYDRTGDRTYDRNDQQDFRGNVGRDREHIGHIPDDPWRESGEENVYYNRREEGTRWQDRDRTNGGDYGRREDDIRREDSGSNWFNQGGRNDYTIIRNQEELNRHSEASRQQGRGPQDAYEREPLDPRWNPSGSQPERERFPERIRDVTRTSSTTTPTTTTTTNAPHEEGFFEGDRSSESGDAWASSESRPLREKAPPAFVPGYDTAQLSTGEGGVYDPARGEYRNVYRPGPDTVIDMGDMLNRAPPDLFSSEDIYIEYGNPMMEKTWDDMMVHPLQPSLPDSENEVNPESHGPPIDPAAGLNTTYENTFPEHTPQLPAPSPDGSRRDQVHRYPGNIREHPPTPTRIVDRPKNESLVHDPANNLLHRTFYMHTARGWQEMTETRAVEPGEELILPYLPGYVRLEPGMGGAGHSASPGDEDEDDDEGYDDDDYYYDYDDYDQEEEGGEDHGIIDNDQDGVVDGGAYQPPYGGENGFAHIGVDYEATTCGGEPYDMTLYICCEATLRYRIGVKPQCCGSQAFDAFMYHCCDGHIRRSCDSDYIPKRTSWGLYI